MKVLHVIPSVSKVHGGPTHALAMMERSLAAMGVEVTTATTDDDGPGRRLSVASRVRSINGVIRYYARKQSEFYKFSPGLVIWLLRYASEFDVVHIHALFSFSSVAAAWVARLRCVPYIIRPLGTLNGYGVKQRRPWLKALSFRLIEKEILRNAAAIHFTSREEWEEALELGVPLRGVVIPLGVDRVAVLGTRILPFEIRPGQKVVLFLSRLDPKKNVEGLIRAFALVRQASPDAVLVVAGDGPAGYVGTLKALAASEGIGDATHWIGYVEGAQKWAVLDAADVFVLPSFSENFGIAAVEAMIAGLPCVVGRGVAISSAIAKAGAGIVTEPDPQAIARALASLLGDPELWPPMGARAKELAAREYSSNVMARRLVDLYVQISGRREASAKESRPAAAGSFGDVPQRPSGAKDR